jgi:hypothetical protein
VTTFGRPDFNRVLNELSLKHARKTIGVFFCGPKPLAQNLGWSESR